MRRPGNIRAMLIAALQMLAFVVIAAAAVRPGIRRHAAAILILLAAGAVITAVSASEPRKLAITHQFSAYVELQVKAKDFPIETVTAPGDRWAWLCAIFGFGWGGWLLFRRNAPVARSFGMPLALCWTGVALQLGLEKCAAPGVLLAPFDLAPDRVMLPATVAGALLLARPGRKILHLVFYLSLFIAVSRLPLAVFGTLATQGGWGTHLDVHASDFFVPPGSGRGVEVEQGGQTQLFWMVWAPHLIVFPAIYMMSTGGLAFFALMLRRQREVDAVWQP